MKIHPYLCWCDLASCQADQTLHMDDIQLLFNSFLYNLASLGTVTFLLCIVSKYCMTNSGSFCGQLLQKNVVCLLLQTLLSFSVHCVGTMYRERERACVFVTVVIAVTTLLICLFLFRQVMVNQEKGDLNTKGTLVRGGSLHFIKYRKLLQYKTFFPCRMLYNKHLCNIPLCFGVHNLPIIW